MCLCVSMYAAAAAKSLQSCPTLCDPMDVSPPGSSVPGILQARTLEWVAISFSSAGKWKAKVKSFSHVRLLATPWTAAYQAPPSMGLARQEYWSRVPLPSPFLCIVSCYLQTVTVWLLLFQFDLLLFLFLLWLLWLGFPKQCCIKMVRVNILVMFLVLDEMLSALGLLYMAFIMLKYVPSLPTFWRVFTINECWILLKDFSAYFEIIMWFLILQFVNMCITLIDLLILKNLYNWAESHLIMCDPFNVLLDLDW